MKLRILCKSAGTLLASSVFAHSATFVSDFSGLGTYEPLVPASQGTGPGYDGWTQSEVNPTDPGNPSQSFPIAYGQPITGVGQGVAVGGTFGTPTASFFYIEHTVSIPFAFSSMSSTFTFDRNNPALPPADAAADADVQNRFEIGAYGTGGVNLFSLVAEPSLDPDIWLIAYRTEGGTTQQLSTTHAFGIDNLYDMTVNFTPSGSDINFSLAINSLPTFTGTLPGLASESFESIRITMDKVEGTDPSTEPFEAYGTNFIATTNISAVPEPSSILLLGLAGCAAVRRRRAA